MADYRSRGLVLREPGEDDERREFLVERVFWTGQHRAYGQNTCAQKYLNSTMEDGKLHSILSSET